MRTLVLTFAAAVGFGLFSEHDQRQQKGGEEISGPYEAVSDWPQPFARAGYVQGSQGAVFAETPHRVFLGNRGELKLPDKLPNTFSGAWGSLGRPAIEPKPEMRNCIVIVDGNGKMLESWTQWDHLFSRGPHAIKISPYDPERHVWVVDDSRHQIFKFTNDGKRLVMTLGELDVAGNDANHFGRPTDIAWLPDGTFFVSDGYANTRVAKFDRNGKFLIAWGKRGTGPGEFDSVHSVATDDKRRVYVADRRNRRVQVFDEDGRFIDSWPDIFDPTHIAISGDQHLWVADSTTNKFLKYDRSGELLYSWGTYGTFPGAVWGVHQFSVDSDGNLYVAEALGGRTQKLRAKPGADRTKVIVPPLHRP